MNVLIEKTQLGARLRKIDALQDLLDLPLIVGLKAAARTQYLAQCSCRVHCQVMDYRGGLLFRRGGLVW